MNNNKTAIILFQLGGPSSINEVDQFLYNYFCDPNIFELPLGFLFRKPFATLFSQLRSRTTKHHYIVIGGKSPILELTRNQADLLENELRKEVDAKVFVAMRYSNPSIASVVNNLALSNFNCFILLPMFPQYSKPTTASSIIEWNKQCMKKKFQPTNQYIINNFYQHPLFIEALVEQINSSFLKFKWISTKDIILIFTAYGVPYKFVESGDPYKEQIENTVSLLVAKGNWDSQYILCYQGMVGLYKSLKPSLKEVISKFAGTGSRYLLIAPISFVTECIETLFEIDVEARQLATNLGVKQFELVPALNSNKKFIEALKDIILNK